LFSLGDLLPIQKICYHFLPMMDSFRHPGTIRVFTTIGIIILSACSLDDFIKNGKDKKVLWLSYLIALVLAGLTLYFIFSANGKDPSHTVLLKSTAELKEFLHGLNYNRFAAFIGILQLLFIIAFIIMQHRQQLLKKWLVPVIVSNLILFAWIALPFTVVSQYHTKTVNSYMESFPEGYPDINLNASVESEVVSDSVFISLHGYHNFYNKKITIQDHIITPTLNTAYGNFLHDKALRKTLKDYPFAFIIDSTGNRLEDEIHLKEFSPNRFVFEVSSKIPGRFVIFQQFNHNWKSKVNGMESPLIKTYHAFMGTRLPAGRSVIEWYYYPKRVYAAMMVSGIFLIILLFYFAWQRKLKTVHD
jgi:hypothetical protein